MIILEGANWSNDWSVFSEPFDENAVYQFHYYCWDVPEHVESIERFLKKREEFDAEALSVPLQVVRSALTIACSDPLQAVRDLVPREMIDDAKYSPPEISAMVLQKLKQTAEALLRKRMNVESLISLQVKKAWHALDSAQQQVAVNQSTLESADENLRVSQERYQEGEGTNTEVLDAQTLRTQAYSNHYRSIYDAVLAEMP